MGNEREKQEREKEGGKREGREGQRKGGVMHGRGAKTDREGKEKRR